MLEDFNASLLKEKAKPSPISGAVDPLLRGRSSVGCTAITDSANRSAWSDALFAGCGEFEKAREFAY
jgi:hypothetical protein